MTENAVRISEHPFIDEATCKAVVSVLDSHPELALDRNPARPGTFVTYGRAAYLDVCLPSADAARDYYGVIAHTNRALLGILGDLLENLRDTVGELLGQPVCYAPDALAVPGIHIFRGDGIRSAGEAGVHFDVQFQKLALPAPPDPEEQPISVTLLLHPPACGTGLQVHNVSYQDYERAYRMGRIRSLDQLVKRRTSAYYPYTPGNLIVHHGLIVHCLATPGPIAAGDQRITLQAHGIRCDGRWILYW
jgi:hypothetical protein